MALIVSKDKYGGSYQENGNTDLTPPVVDTSGDQPLSTKSPVCKESRCVELDYEILGKNHCVCFSSDAPELTYYKLLRTQIMQRCKSNGWNTIMITSALPGEGKTLTAINLAATFAKAYGQTAILIDADLQRQSVHQYLGISSNVGLADYLRNDVALKDIIIWLGREELNIISGGNALLDSAELISSPKMAELVADMKTRFADRYIFFDLPPLLVEPDALAFAPLVDCIIMVIRPKTSFNALQKSLEMIPEEKFLGFVLNGAEPSNDDYYRLSYRYGYGYGYKK